MKLVRPQLKVNARPIWFENPRLDTLQPAVRDSSIRLLHFGMRVSNALEGSGIGLIGQLIEGSRCGFVAPAAGTKSVREIVDALDSLSRSIGNDGRVDWLRYAAHRRFLLLPKKEFTDLSIRQFIRIFPNIAQTAIETRWGARGEILFRVAILGDDSGVTTGQRMGFTRQATSLIRREMLRMLRGAIFNDDYRGCRFRLRPAFVVHLRRLKEVLDATEGRAIAYTEWEQILTQTWGVLATDLGQVETLLFSIFDYRLMRPSGGQSRSIVLPNGRAVLSLRAAIAETERLLTRQFPNGISKQQLLKELRHSKGKLAPSLREISTLATSMFIVENFSPKGRVRAHRDEIPRISDQLERILRARGRPMHRRELASKLRRFKGRAGSIRSAQHVGVILCDDKRFKVIARTGVWLLREWNQVETRTVVEIAADLLHQAARPMTEAELFGVIFPMRAIKKQSIGTLLREDERFLRTAPRTWKLR